MLTIELPFSRLLNMNHRHTKQGAVRAKSLHPAFAALLTLAALNGAVAQEVPAASSTASQAEAGTARIRLFGQNGAMVAFYQNSTCIGGNGPKTTVSGGVGDAFASFLGRAKNTSIGMSETPTTTGLANRDGIMSKAYFREYEIPANQPLTLSMHFQNAAGVPGSLYCSTLGGTFTPEGGKEYEATLDFDAKKCTAHVREIQKNEQAPATLRDIDIAPTRDCD